MSSWSTLGSLSLAASAGFASPPLPFSFFSFFLSCKMM